MSRAGTRMTMTGTATDDGGTVAGTLFGTAALESALTDYDDDPMRQHKFVVQPGQPSHGKLAFNPAAIQTCE